MQEILQPKPKNKQIIGRLPGDRQNISIKTILVIVVALIIGIGGGSLLVYFFVPRLNPATRVPPAFAIDNRGFERVDLGVERFPELHEQRAFVTERIFEWIVHHRDARGIFVPTTDCVFNLMNNRNACVNPSEVNSGFFSNRSFQAPLWGMYKYYQNTRDERALVQIEQDLAIIQAVILNQPEVYMIQNNDYSCLFLKDLFFSPSLSEEARQTIFDICSSSYYEVVVSPDEDFDYRASISQKVNWLLHDEFDMNRVQAEMERVGIEDMADYLRNTFDFRITADILVTSIINPDAPISRFNQSQMDFLLTQYAWLLNQGPTNDFYSSGVVMALAFYAQYEGLDRNSEVMELARQIYNRSFTSGEMTVDDMLNFALVQYHLGMAISQIQSALLEVFYDEELNNFGGLLPNFFQIPNTGRVTDELVMVSGSIVLNGLLMGVLSI